MNDTMRPITSVLLGVMVLLFILIQLSNALLPLPPLQKPGNHFDESRLSVMVRTCDDVNALLKDLQWGPSIVYSAYYLNAVFGIGTYGRRVCAVVLVALALVCAGYFCRRRGAFGDWGLLLFGFLFITGAEVSVYATLGLVTYPMLITLSVLFLGMVVRYYGEPIPLHWLWGASLVFALTTYINNVGLVAIYAVACTLFIGEVGKRTWSVKGLLASGARFGVLISLPTLFTLAVILYTRPQELFNPYRSLSLYFFTSDASKDLLGMVSFVVRTFGRLVVSVTALNPKVAGSMVAALSPWVLGGAFMLGLIASLFSSNRVRFSLALFFLFGTIGHIILSFATLLPYGEIRYFLPFFLLYPLFAACGLCDAAKSAQWLCRLTPERVPPSLQRLAAAVFAGVLIVSTALYAGNTLGKNAQTHHILQHGMNHYFKDTGSPPYALVLDTWTATTIEDEYPGMLKTDHYVLATNLKTAWGLMPKGQDRMEDWVKFLEGHKRLYAITSMQFTPKNYEEIFSEAARRFTIATLRETLTYNFIEFKPVSP